jgi:hypothetical protein
MRRLTVSILALIAIAVSGSTRPALAQEEPPARVGRVSFVAGQLGFHAAGEAQWSAAAVNYPVATGGAFWTDPKSKAEIRIGGQTIDLSGDTEIDLTQLNQQVIQIALPQGRIALRLRQLAEGNSVEIDLPRGGVWLLQPGRYDIDAGTPDLPARVMVFEGSARFVGDTLEQGITAGEAAVIGGTDALTASVERATPDAFVEWYRARDYPEQRLAAPYYVSPDMTGYEDLDQYGSWGTVPDYGEVWYPSSVAADWAPYRDGHWVSVEPWGWTWVDAAPWGFAPSHYGRWARIQDRWGWLPGRFVPQPVYAPALVAFIGDSRGGFGGAGARGPAVGWFPLGPDEVYWPSYSRDPNYIRNVNVANVSQARIASIANIANPNLNRPITANQRAAIPPPQAANQNFVNRAAATVVPLRAFTSAATVAPAALHVAPQALQQARISLPPPQAARPRAATPSGRAPSAAAPLGAPSTAAAIHPPGVPVTGAPLAGPGNHPPGIPGTGAPLAGPGNHPPGAPGTGAPLAGPGNHPPGVPGTGAPLAGPGNHPPGVPGTGAPLAGPGNHPPGVPSASAPTALAPAPPRPDTRCRRRFISHHRPLLRSRLRIRWRSRRPRSSMPRPRHRQRTPRRRHRLPSRPLRPRIRRRHRRRLRIPLDRPRVALRRLRGSPRRTSRNRPVAERGGQFRRGLTRSAYARDAGWSPCAVCETEERCASWLNWRPGAWRRRGPGRTMRVDAALEDPGGSGAVAHPDLRLTPAVQRVARRIDRIEEGLFLVEIGAVDGVVEADDPPGTPPPPAYLECHDPHPFPPRTALPPAKILRGSSVAIWGTSPPSGLHSNHYPQRSAKNEGQFGSEGPNPRHLAARSLIL